MFAAALEALELPGDRQQLTKAPAGGMCISARQLHQQPVIAGSNTTIA